jgi:pyruvate/2-oxoglutarate dehydrogenase complex dihydrolipoamide acyltransferase (E2) component
MTAKLLALTSVIGLATVCVVRAQSPTPSEASTASPSPAEKAASPSPGESPTASPKAKPTPKKEKAERARPAASPTPAVRTTEEAVNQPAPGGGPGLVWVNTEAGVYHGQRSPFYGTTGKGKYMTEHDAIKAGYKRAPKGR